MKKLSLSVLALYAGILAAFSQAGTDSSSYKPRRLSLSEVDFVSAYYRQNGNHSAVTGGVGTERLSDFSNSIEAKWVRYDRRNREHNLNVELGIDHYTSASSDQIDPTDISSASYADTRIYPSVGYTVKNGVRRRSIGGTLSFSKEYDYTSVGVGARYSKASADESRELGVNLQAYLDQWRVILPVELRTSGRKDEGYAPRRTYSASFSLSQVVNTRLQVVGLLELVAQEGLLATDYQRVYFKDGPAQIERLPSFRFKLPAGVRVHYFAGDRVLLRGLYRFYADDWGVRAHTAELEAPLKATPYFSVSPFYRFYTQTAARYFAPYRAHPGSEEFYTSDYDLSALHSHYFGAGLRWVPESGIFHLAHWRMAELRYGHYLRSDGLGSDIVSLNLQFK
ncbi:MAG: DUF3570 domain-containing protein [Chitinophagaceae bacterium]|nr:MAG: DUF3570 domain-containing protein [Chitinophagaceae bacterium]